MIKTTAQYTVLQYYYSSTQALWYSCILITRRMRNDAYLYTISNNDVSYALRLGLELG